jgi:DNA repair exonuclease SbcCD ATPase subunit
MLSLSNLIHTLSQGVLLSISCCVAIVPTSLHAAPDNSAATGKYSKKWYRTYVQGVPVLSSTITEQHLRYGYEVLDKNMVVVKRVAPYTAEDYAKQKALRDKQEAQRQADRNLKEVHISSVNATTQRDRILAEMTAREQFLQAQLADLNKELAQEVATAASFERRQTKIPFAVQQRLEDKRTQVAQMEKNLDALKQRQSEISTQYNQIIQRLTYLEDNPEALAPRASTAVRTP